MKSVVVIGAGVGGITAAAKLAQHGYRVTVLEKNDAPGGRCGHVEFEDYQFDTGPTLFLMPEFYSGAFRSLGERMEDYLELTRVDPSYHLHFSDGTDLVLTSDVEGMREQLEAIEPGSYANFLRYLEHGARNYRLVIPRFMSRSYDSLGRFLTPSNLFAIARINPLTKHHDHVGRYFRDERLRTAFTFRDLYVGLSPYAAPATFSLIQYTEFAHGVWFPKGGMYSVVRALVSIAKKWAVRFVFNAPVARIDVAGDRATGVTLDNGERLEADIILANADLSYVYHTLLPQDETTRRLEGKKHGTSAVTFLWGLNKRYPQLAAHNLFFASDIRGSYAPLFDRRGLPEDPHFYIHAPARIDPSMAPPGGDALYVGIPSGHIDERSPQDWEAIKARAREAVLCRLEKCGLGDLRNHITFEMTRTPLDWERKYNLAKGSTHGLSHELTQMAYLRPHNRHARYRNLYFVGASTQPGTGLPNVLLSASFATQRIIKDDTDTPQAYHARPPDSSEEPAGLRPVLEKPVEARL